MKEVLKYVSLIKGAIMTTTIYQFALLFTFVGNLVYIVVINYLWRSVYGDREILQGMTFNEVFVYLTLASSIFILFTTYTDWFLSEKILEGSIAVDLIRPVDFQFYILSTSLGFVVSNFVVVTIPSIVVLFGVFGASIPLGWNLLFFPLSIVLAFLLSFNLDYIVGLTAFYTESVWGISTAKDVIVTTLSGALIPLAFFPDQARQILEVLPFQAIYNTPLRIATSGDLQVTDYIELLGIQLLWLGLLLILSRLFYRQAIKVLIINGG